MGGGGGFEEEECKEEAYFGPDTGFVLHAVDTEYFKKGEDGQDSRPTKKGKGEMDDEVVPLDTILLDYIRHVLQRSIR